MFYKTFSNFSTTGRYRFIFSSVNSLTGWMAAAGPAAAVLFRIFSRVPPAFFIPADAGFFFASGLVRRALLIGPIRLIGPIVQGSRHDA